MTRTRTTVKITTVRKQIGRFTNFTTKIAKFVFSTVHFLNRSVLLRPRTCPTLSRLFVVLSMKGTHVNMIWTTIGLEIGIAKGPTSSKNIVTLLGSLNPQLLGLTTIRYSISRRVQRKGIYLLITLTLTSAELKRSTAAD